MDEKNNFDMYQKNLVVVRYLLHEWKMVTGDGMWSPDTGNAETYAALYSFLKSPATGAVVAGNSEVSVLCI